MKRLRLWRLREGKWRQNQVTRSTSAKKLRGHFLAIMVVNESVHMDRRNDRQLLVPVNQIPYEIKRFFEHKKAKLVQKIHGSNSLDPDDLRTISWLIEIALVIFMICAICAILFLLFMCVHQIWDNRQRDQARKARLMALKQQAYFHRTQPEDQRHQAQHEVVNHQLSTGSFDSFSDEPQVSRAPSGDDRVRPHQPLFKKCSYNPSLKSPSAPQDQIKTSPSTPPPEFPASNLDDRSLGTSDSSSTSCSRHFQEEIQINVASPPFNQPRSDQSHNSGWRLGHLSVANPNENDRSLSVYEEIPPPPPPHPLIQNHRQTMADYLMHSDPPTLRALEPLPYDETSLSSSNGMDEFEPDYQRVAHVKTTPF